MNKTREIVTCVNAWGIGLGFGDYLEDTYFSLAEDVHEHRL
jgi:hypothetical protein